MSVNDTINNNIPLMKPEAGVAPWVAPNVRASCWLFCILFPIFYIPVIWSNLPLPSVLLSPQNGVLLLTLIICAITDLGWRKIPNWATYPALGWLVFMPVFQGVRDSVTRFMGHVGPVVELDGPELSTTGQSTLEIWSWLEPLTTTLSGGIVCFFVMFFVFRMAGGGAGDVKLATVIGAALGIELGIAALAASYILAAVGVLIWLAWTAGPRLVVLAFARKLLQTFVPRSESTPPDVEIRILRHRVALGPFFAAGTVFVVLRSVEAWQ
jgi:Flp pilus assembly protein protease CpaA